MRSDAWHSGVVSFNPACRWCLYDEEYWLDLTCSLKSIPLDTASSDLLTDSLNNYCDVNEEIIFISSSSPCLVVVSEWRKYLITEFYSCLIKISVSLTHFLHFLQILNVMQGFGICNSYLSPGEKIGRKLLIWVCSKQLISFVGRCCFLSWCSSVAIVTG